MKDEGNKGQDMEDVRKSLKKYFKEKCYTEMCYGYSEEGWMQLIDDFFETYQPERSKREDSWLKNVIIDTLFDDDGNLLPEMRCSEHDGNIVRDK